MASRDRVKRAWNWYSHIDTAASLPDRIGRHVLRAVPALVPAVIGLLLQYWWATPVVFLVGWAAVEGALTWRATRRQRTPEASPTSPSGEHAGHTRGDEERQRRARVMAELRAKWCQQRLMDPRSPILMPWEDDDPPAAWLNRELAKRGELWTVPED